MNDYTGSADWNFRVEYRRTNREDDDLYSELIANAGTAWNINAELGTEFRGGKATLTCDFRSIEYTHTLNIRGQNATENVFSQYITNNQGVHWYANAIATVESNHMHFNTAGVLGPNWGDYRACPNRGDTFDWGIMQLANPAPSKQALWNWQDNVDEGIDRLDNFLNNSDPGMGAEAWLNRQFDDEPGVDPNDPLGTGSSIVEDGPYGPYSNVNFEYEEAYSVLDALVIGRYNGGWAIWYNTIAGRWQFVNAQSTQPDRIQRYNYLVAVCGEIQ